MASQHTPRHKGAHKGGILSSHATADRTPARPKSHRKATPPTQPTTRAVQILTSLTLTVGAVTALDPKTGTTPAVQAAASGTPANRTQDVSRSATRVDPTLPGLTDRDEMAKMTSLRRAASLELLRRETAEKDRQAAAAKAAVLAKAKADAETALRAQQAAAAQAQIETARRAKPQADLAAAANLDPGSLQALAYKVMTEAGFTPDQWDPLNRLITRESGWRVTATNAQSGAYGLPQALPGTKMGTVADDWRTNPRTQLIWMMRYIRDRYGDPAGAWAHSQRTGWY